MNKRRQTIVYLVLGALFISALYFVADRMIFNKEKYFHSIYIDRAFIKLMERLIEQKVFRIEGDLIVIDENALKMRHLKSATLERVRNSIPFLYISKGRIVFDNTSVSISNNRTFMEDRVERGRFIDRNGVVLAWSDIEEKTWSQERKYTAGPEFYHIIGHYSPIFGKRNLEKELNNFLNGSSHMPIFKKTSDPLNNVKLGDDIILTIDSNVQRFAYDLMKDKKGAVVVLDVRTGDIISAVSTPSFDPNSRDRNEWRNAFSDIEQRPYENRAFSTVYPPGSTFKTLVASAWLERSVKGEIKDDITVSCNSKKNRYDISDIHNHGTTNLSIGYSESCNIYFSEIGVALGHNLLDYARKFGFNNTINLMPNIKNHSYIAIASRAFSWGSDDKHGGSALFSAIDFKRNPKLVAQGSIGQNIVMATPVQMVMTASAIANKGVILNPNLIKEIRTGDGKKILVSAAPLEMGRVVQEKTALEMSRLMEDVMTSGTGSVVKKIYIMNAKYILSSDADFSRGENGKFPEAKLVRVAGKTGTAEVGDKNGNGKIDADERPHSWFIGFAPADNPRYAVAVVAENEGFGSLTAAPIAVEVLAEALNSGKQGIK